MLYRLATIVLLLVPILAQQALAGDKPLIMAQTPAPRPMTPRIDQLKEESPELKACRAESKKLKERVGALERDLKETKAKLAAATRAGLCRRGHRPRGIWHREVLWRLCVHERQVQ